MRAPLLLLTLALAHVLAGCATCPGAVCVGYGLGQRFECGGDNLANMKPSAPCSCPIETKDASGKVIQTQDAGGALVCAALCVCPLGYDAVTPANGPPYCAPMKLYNCGDMIDSAPNVNANISCGSKADRFCTRAVCYVMSPASASAEAVKSNCESGYTNGGFSANVQGVVSCNQSCAPAAGSCRQTPCRDLHIPGASTGGLGYDGYKDDPANDFLCTCDTPKK